MQLQIRNKLVRSVYKGIIYVLRPPNKHSLTDAAINNTNYPSELQQLVIVKIGSR